MLTKFTFLSSSGDISAYLTGGVGHLCGELESKAMVSFAGILPGLGGAMWMIPLLSSRN